jgi:hypothetical protein
MVEPEAFIFDSEPGAIFFELAFGFVTEFVFASRPRPVPIGSHAAYLSSVVPTTNGRILAEGQSSK